MYARGNIYERTRQCNNDTFWPESRDWKWIRVGREINENEARGNERLIYVDRELIGIEGTVNAVERCGRTYS